MYNIFKNKDNTKFIVRVELQVNFNIVYKTEREKE